MHYCFLNLDALLLLESNDPTRSNYAITRYSTQLRFDWIFKDHFTLYFFSFILVSRRGESREPSDEKGNLRHIKTCPNFAVGFGLSCVQGCSKARLDRLRHILAWPIECLYPAQVDTG